MGELQSRYKTIIVDDEQNAIDVIIHHLNDYPHVEISGCFGNAIEASTFLKNEKIDLMFLDIQMPGISGIDFLRSLKNPPVTFLTTAYRHYAPEAFELNVLDYLLKPISSNRFKTAMEKFENQIKIKNFSPTKEDNYIIIRANRSDIKLKLSDILYFESKGDYIKIHLNGRHILTKETLKRISQRLPAGFVQIHRSYIVNSQHIDIRTGTSVQINEEIIPLSRKFRS